MPAGDRTGPEGLGPRTGRAAGYCSGYNFPGYTNPEFGRRRGRGLAFGRGGRGGGRGGGGGRGRAGGRSLGAGGTCVCPKCGATAPHERGMPCPQMPCPKCGTTMVRRD